MVVRLAVPDLVSPSYFPALAAVELGTFARHGLDVEVTLRFPVTDAAAELRDGQWDLLAGASHVIFQDQRGPGGVKLLAALSKFTYWFLVVRPEEPARDPAALRDVRIGVAPGPDLALRVLFADLGVDLAVNGIELLPVPARAGADPGLPPSFGVSAAEALAAGTIDAFWANGMGAKVALESGHGRIMLDGRRVDGLPRDYTFAGLMAPTAWIADDPDRARRAVRALVEAQQLLRDDPGRATSVGTALFPPYEAGLIADLIAADAPFYDPVVDEATLGQMASFAARGGLSVPPDAVETAVASEVVSEWSA